MFLCAAGAQGAYVWSLKDWIDRRFMRAFGEDLDFSKKMGMEPAVMQVAGSLGLTAYSWNGQSTLGRGRRC